MPSVTPSSPRVKSSQFSRQAEDELDHQENLRRSADDVRALDAAFVGGSALVTLLWTVLFTGATGGIVAVLTSVGR